MARGLGPQSTTLLSRWECPVPVPTRGRHRMSVCRLDAKGEDRPIADAPRLSIASDMDQKTGGPNRVLFGKLLAIPAVIIGWAVGIFIGRFEPAAIAVAAGGSTIVVLAAAIILRAARREAWYWVFLATVSSVHAIGIILIPWPKHYSPGKQDILFGLPDLIVVLVAGFLVAKSVNSAALNQNG